jgi:2-oxoisovalerate dehydrogenase E1 component alpha subunit
MPPATTAMLQSEVTAEVKAAQKAAEANGILGHGLHQPLETLFEDVFAEEPWHLREQTEQMLAERKRKWPER